MPPDASDHRWPWIVGFVVVLGVLAFGVGMDGPPDLGAVMAEVDGVHPVRAAAAFDRAYALGGGFLDKYPPLGSFLMGLAGRLGDPGFGEAVAGVEGLAPAPRREALFAVGERIAALVRLQRWLSLIAVALSLGLLGGAVTGGARRLGLSTVAAVAGGLFAAGLLGSADVVVYHATSTNVDAAVLLAGTVTLLAVCTGRFRTAAVALGLVVAVKDPAFVLGPVVLLAAVARGGVRVVVPTAALALAVYALASGALTGPALWWDHVVYLLHGGVEEVGRIDHASASEWFGLLRLVERLVRDAVGPAGLALALFGLMLARELPGPGTSRPDRLALLVIAATLLLFVLPVGFVYARFLLLPLAALAALSGLGFAAVWQRLGWAAPLFVILLAVGQQSASAAVFESRVLVTDRWAHTETPPRLAAAAQVRSTWPEGTSVVIFADEREHGPPLDPRRRDVDVRGLDALIPSVAAWRAGESPRPDVVLLMTFPTDPPSGRSEERPAPPRVGSRLAGWLDVVGVHGVPTGSRAERSLPWRPTLTVLRPVE